MEHYGASGVYLGTEVDGIYAGATGTQFHSPHGGRYLSDLAGRIKEVQYQAGEPLNAYYLHRVDARGYQSTKHKPASARFTSHAMA